MKDTWREKFQESLGDYELDLPAPGRPRIVRWLPPLLAAGAAAALALLLLLPGGKTSLRGGVPEGLIAAASPAQMDVPAPTLTSPRLLLSDLRRPAANHPVSSSAPSGPTVDEPVAEDPVADNTVPTEPDADETPVTEVDQPDVTTDTQPDITDWSDIDEPTHASRRRGGFSAKVHAGNFIGTGSLADLLREKDAVGTWTLNNVSGITDMRYAYAAYNGNSAIGMEEIDKSEPVVLMRTYNSAELGSTEIHYAPPVKAGVSLRYDFSPVFGLESGFGYAYRHAWQVFEPSGNTRHYRGHYLDVPLKADLVLLRRNDFHLYAALGGELEWMVSGRTDTDSELRSYALSATEHPLLGSLVASAGLEYAFSRWLCLYGEPGVAWYFTPQGNWPVYDREHPFSFDFKVGLRFLLGDSR